MDLFLGVVRLLALLAVALLVVFIIYYFAMYDVEEAWFEREMKRIEHRIQNPSLGDELLVKNFDVADLLLQEGWRVKFASENGWALVYKGKGKGKDDNE